MIRPSILFFAKNPHNVAVYERVLRRLLADGRVRLYLTSKNKHTRPPNALFKPFDLPGAKIIDHRFAALRRFDLYISPDMFLLSRRSRIKVHTFHGISIKGRAFSDKALVYDKLFLIGPYQKRRFVELGVTTEDDPRFVPVGMPKTDAFFDGSLDREAFLRDHGLDPSRPTLLYAPTWRPEASLHTIGDELIRSMRGAPWNLLVKLHDLCMDPRTNPVDWARRLPEITGGNVAVARGADSTPALFAADLLITDASSVATEFTLLDRPLVFIDVPELFNKYRDSIDLEGWGQSSGPVAKTVAEVHDRVGEMLADASGFAATRKKIAGEGFYNPGRATEAALDAIYDIVGLPPGRVHESSQC